MATWTRATQPTTTETECRVVNLETGEEGYVSISLRGPGHRLMAPVCRVERHFDANGVDLREPTKTVLDRDPTFV